MVPAWSGIKLGNVLVDFCRTEFSVVMGQSQNFMSTGFHRTGLVLVALILNKVVLLRTIRVLTSTEVSVHFESVNVLTSVEVR